MVPRRHLVSLWGWMFLIGFPALLIYGLVKWVIG